MKNLIPFIERKIKESAAFSFEPAFAALTPFIEENACEGESEPKSPGEGRVKDWVNLGGQIVPAFRVDGLRNDIRKRRFSSWKAIHVAYDSMASRYEGDKTCHARGVFVRLFGMPTQESFIASLEKTARLSANMLARIKQSRTKDFTDHFRGITYRNPEEMNEVLGNLDDDPFVKIAEKNHHDFVERIENLLEKL